MKRIIHAVMPVNFEHNGQNYYPSGLEETGTAFLDPDLARHRRDIANIVTLGRIPGGTVGHYIDDPGMVPTWLLEKLKIGQDDPERIMDIRFEQILTGLATSDLLKFIEECGPAFYAVVTMEVEDADAIVDLVREIAQNG